MNDEFILESARYLADRAAAMAQGNTAAAKIEAA
jgi:hypothetical protein